jgi:hypothetical protein
VVRDRAARDLEQPRAEALVVAEPGEAALHPDVDVLEHVLDIRARDAPRDAEHAGARAWTAHFSLKVWRAGLAATVIG